MEEEAVDQEATDQEATDQEVHPGGSFTGPFDGLDMKKCQRLAELEQVRGGLSPKEFERFRAECELDWKQQDSEADVDEADVDEADVDEAEPPIPDPSPQMAEAGDVDGLWQRLQTDSTGFLDVEATFRRLFRAIEVRCRQDPAQFAADLYCRMISFTSILLFRAVSRLADDERES